MRVKKLLVAFLLGAGLCFVPVLGYGEVKTIADKNYMDIRCLRGEVEYMMSHPTSFLYVSIYYDPMGLLGIYYPEGVDTKGKICISIYDTRAVFSGKSGKTLLSQFEKELEAVYSCPSIDAMTDYEHTDIVAEFYTREQNLLGYFCQGEYHLWEE